MRDRKRIAMKGGGDLKRDVFHRTFLLQPLTGHVLTNQSALTSANSATLTKNTSVYPFT